MSVNLAPIDILIFVTGFVFLLKKIADMDRYQTLRTIVLTTILGAIVIYFFLDTLNPIQRNTCVLSFP